MKAIMVMYDSLNRGFLESYGCDWTHTPNFKRLAERTTRFDNAYVCGMPCMPARRELHTGRPNFLHRSWGPLEPFDDSMPEILQGYGIYTHLCSDHGHYWEDGGATYHTRYSSWENARGQEGDPWKSSLNAPKAEHSPFVAKQAILQNPWFQSLLQRDNSNRLRQQREEQTAQAMTFRNGLEFINENAKNDNWFLQIETFDPHEPFFVDKHYRDEYPRTLSDEDAIGSDWPPYAPVQEGQEVIDHVRGDYAALVTKCDHYLGLVLDKMDEYGLWKDTMLIVCTDHGFLLGEHGWWGKTAMPLFQEIAHTPLFIYDPRIDCAGKTCDAFVQMIDFAPTLLSYFGVPVPKDMRGSDLRPVMEQGKSVRECAVFGFHGEELNITDGEFLYRRAPQKPDNPYYNYTLMPTHMRKRFSPEELADMELVEPFSFTKGCKVLKVRAKGSEVGGAKKWERPSVLFHLTTDPGETTDCSAEHPEVIERFCRELSRFLRENDAPEELYERYGLEK